MSVFGDSNMDPVCSAALGVGGLLLLLLLLLMLMVLVGAYYAPSSFCHTFTAPSHIFIRLSAF